LADAREKIKREKETAKLELQKYTSKIAIQIAENILRGELKNKAKHEEQIQALLNEISSKN
jgi:F0F1-type ATP synthase membrane subunit b/b'